MSTKLTNGVLVMINFVCQLVDAQISDKTVFLGVSLSVFGRD